MCKHVQQTADFLEQTPGDGPFVVIPGEVEALIEALKAGPLKDYPLVPPTDPELRTLVGWDAQRSAGRSGPGGPGGQGGQVPR